MSQYIYAGLMAQQEGRTGPKYRQIADDLLARIQGGEFTVGAQLPTKAELMERHHVALNTVARAIDELRAAGRIETVQGAGMFVREAPPETSSPAAVTAKRLDDLESATAELREALIRVRRESQDHARLLARMRRRMEEAGITLADADQQDAQAL